MTTSRSDPIPRYNRGALGMWTDPLGEWVRADDLSRWIDRLRTIEQADRHNEAVHRLRDLGMQGLPQPALTLVQSAMTTGIRQHCADVVAGRAQAVATWQVAQHRFGVDQRDARELCAMLKINPDRMIGRPTEQ
jgi:hypothetical protein